MNKFIESVNRIDIHKGKKGFFELIGGIPRLFIIMIGGIVLLALINAPEVLAFLWVIGIIGFYVYVKVMQGKETREMGERFA